MHGLHICPQPGAANVSPAAAPRGNVCMGYISGLVDPDAFGDFGGRIWLNAAHQDPLPRVAVAAAEEALAAKASPHLIDDESFVAVPRRLRELLGRLLGAPAEELVL